MLRHRFFIGCFVLLFSLGVSVNALAICLEAKGPTNSGNQIPISISCLHDEESPFLPQVYKGHKKISFPKVEKRTVNAYQGVLFQERSFYPNPLGPSGTIFFSLSITIYQLKTTYRI